MTLPDSADNFVRLCVEVAGGALAVGMAAALALLVVWCIASLLFAMLSAIFDA